VSGVTPHRDAEPARIVFDSSAGHSYNKRAKGCGGGASAQPAVARRYAMKKKAKKEDMKKGGKKK